MAMNLQHLIPPWLISLMPYPPGKPIEELEREFGIHGLDQARLEREPARPVAARARGDRATRSRRCTATRTARRST